MKRADLLLHVFRFKRFSLRDLLDRVWAPLVSIIWHSARLTKIFSEAQRGQSLQWVFGCVDNCLVITVRWVRWSQHRRRR